MMKRFIRQKNRNSKTMGVVLLIAVLCLSVVYAALYSVIYMYGTGSVDISYKDLYYWVDTSTGKGNFYTSCTNGTATSSTGITKMSVAVNALKEGGTIHMLSPYSATAEETVSVNSKTVKIQRYVKKDENDKVELEYSNEKGPLFNVSANLKFDLVKVGTEAPCLTIDGSEITSDASAFNVLSGGTLTLNNDADGVAQGTFVVTGNYASVSGGAVNLSGGSLVANAVQFTDNRSINTLESYGGAIYASGGSNVTLNNCSFENNTARSSTKVNVEGTIYQKGEHPAYGGAVYSISSTVNMSGCTFTANAADVEGDNGVLASGGAVYIGSQSSGSMKDCTVTNNQTSYNGRTGAGVCVAEGGNSFAFSGKTIIEGNHCYFLGADIDNGLNENDNLHLEGEASNISVDTSKLSAGSKIYITASPSPSENSDFRSLISDKSHKASSTGYFESDVGGYVIQSNTDSDDGGLYLVAGSSYDNLWYGCKTIYQFDKYGKVDGNYFHYGFFGDEALTQDTGFTRLTDAVAALKTGGSIHMLETYEVSVSETVNMPKNKTVNVVRESTLGGNSMFKLREGTFIINSLEDSSKIIFDGQNLPASTSGGAFSATRNTTGNGGENNFELNGIQKTDGTKSIIIQNNKITGSYNSGAGLYIWSDKSKISNCEIKNNSTEKTGGGIYFSNSMGSYVLENCNVTSNTASENGGGVYLDYGTYAMLGTMNITGNTVNSAANNLYVVNAVGLASGSSLLNTGSQIGLTTSSTPAEGSPVKFASSATEAMKACFTPDVSDYKVKYDSSDNGGLYLAVLTYSELWYKADENDSNTKKFFEGSDVNNLTATDITKFSKAVQCLRADGKIHMLTTYESTADETTTMPAGKNVTVLRDGTFTNASMFRITGGTFEIDAIDASSSITFDGQKIQTTVDKGGVFYVDGGSIKFSGAEKTVENKKVKTIVIKDNIISLSSDTSDVYAYGGGVYLSSGTNTLENCSITGNTASASSLYSAVSGGGVYITGSGTNTLTNCSITGNTASASSSSSDAYTSGGGVCIKGGKNTLENCSITGNTASTFSATNNVYTYGGGVCIYSNGTNTLTNCSITENKVSSSSSASAFDASYAYAEGGGVCIRGGTNTLENCSITGNTVSASASASASAMGGGVYIEKGTNTLLGTTNITGNHAKKESDSSDNNLYLNSGYTVALSDISGGTLSAGSQIGVITNSDPTSGTDQKFATDATEDEMMNYFTSDKGYVVYKQGTELYLTVAPSELYQSDNKFYLDAEKTKLTNIKTMAEAVKIATTIHMLSAYTTSSSETVEVPSGKDVTVIRDDNFTDASMFKITGGTFEVSATDASSSITFDGNNITPTAEYKGGAFNVYQGSATFKLSGAEKSDGVNKTIVIKNNIVTGTDCWGGGIYCRKTTNVISNCNIINNSAEYGGAVYFDFGTNTVSNCTITDNTCTNLGAGITFWQGTNLMTDTMKITGNKTSGGANSNVFFNSSTVSLADSSSNKQLSTSSQIGVTTSPEPTAGVDVQFATNATAEMQACFTHDPGTSEVVYKDGGLYLTVPTYSELWYKADENDSNTKKFFEGSDVNNLTATDITKFSKAVQSLSASGKIHMLTAYESTADETTTVPAGKNITVLREGTFTTVSMFKITGGTFEVNVTDPTSSITFDGNKIETKVNKGGAFYVGTNGSIKLSGAEKTVENEKVKTIVIKDNIISLSSSTYAGAYGGGVYIESSGTNTLENCSITGNTASVSAGSASSYGGGAYITGSGTNTLENCNITGNMVATSISMAASSYSYGGGVYIESSGTNTLTNCSITGNTVAASSSPPSSYDLAFGGGVYIKGGTNTLENCSITENTVSSTFTSSTYVEAEAYGGGVYIGKGTNTLLGTMNITGNTAKVGSTSSDNNLYLGSGYTVALSDSSGGTLSADSHIGVTTEDSAPAKFATGVTDAIAAVRFCFDDDKKANEVYRIGTELYLGKDSSVTYEKYDNLYYYRTTTTDGLFYKDSSHSSSSSTGITALSEAVGHLNKGGNIYFMSSYSTSTDGEMVVAPPDMGEIHIIRYSSSGTTFDGESMININGLFEVTCPHTNSTIIFDGNNVSTKNTGAGILWLWQTGSARIIGASPSCKNIKFVNSIITTGGGAAIRLGGGDNVIKNCIIEGNKKTSTASEGSGAVLLLEDGGHANSTSMENCDLINNTSAGNAGALYVASGTHSFTNCNITGNTASFAGGGVDINNGTNTLTNCSITGNTASGGSSSDYARGGGVCIEKGTNTLLGTTNITGNTAIVGSDSSDNNLYFKKNYTVALSDGDGNTLSTSSKIGVNTETAPTEGTDVQFATNATEEMKACFTADNSDYYVDYKDSDNSLYLCVRTTYSDLYYKEGEFYSDSACSNSTGITKMSEAVASMTSSGKIHMLSQYASSADETVTVLSGRNVTVLRDGTFTNASMFSITKGTFEVNATNATSSITFDGQKIETTVYEGGAFYVGSGGSLKLSGAEKTVENKKEKTIVIKDNIISRPSDTSDVYTDGGGIYIDGGTNTLTNCSVTGNKAKSSPSRSSASGGGIYINGGKNTLTNCSITGNTATANTSSSSVSGGGVYIWDGTNTLTNCSITDNKAESSYFAASGGGFELRGGTNTLTNCSITGNTASAGSSEASGGGIFTQGSGTNTLSNCSITGNTATANTRSSSFAYGGGIYTYKNITLLGTVNITGNTCKTLYASSDNNLHLGNNFMAALSDSNGNTLSTSSKIGVSTKTAPTSGTDVQFATNATEEMKACFTPGEDNRDVIYKDGGLYLKFVYSDLYYKDSKFYSDSACSSNTGITKFSDAVSNMASSGTIHMMSSYSSSASETVTVPAGKNIQVVRYKDFKDASMFKITGGTFTVNATDASSSITFDGNKIETTVQMGGVFYVDGGNINLNGAEKTVENKKEKTIVIKDNIISRSSGIYSVYVYGGGVYIKSGTNTLTNCSITGNTASSSSSVRGGGVSIKSGTNTLTNCSITGNTASSSGSSDASGGGVFIEGGTNTLTNCSITDNKAESPSSAYGGGVFIWENTTLLGTTNITGNTAKKGSDSSDNNLYLKSGYKVALSSGSKSLSTSSKIGVTTNPAPTSSTPVQFATGATSAMASCFTPDNSSYKVTYSSSALSLATS